MTAVLTCGCGCGEEVTQGRRFVLGHNARLVKRTQCRVVNCAKRAHAGGWCGRHGARIKNYGSLFPVTARLQPELWFWSQVRRPSSPDGCWEWAGDLRNGYGRSHVGGQLSRTGTHAAHRIAYEMRVGPIPADLHLDHLCRNTKCVNPEHLEPVTCAENVRRGLHGVLRTQCPRGHEVNEVTTRVRERDGARRCRRCDADDMRAKRRTPDTKSPSGERTHCPMGHPYDEANTYVNKRGARCCRECARVRRRAKAATVRAEFKTLGYSS